MIKSLPVLIFIHCVAWLLFFSLIITFITASSDGKVFIPLLVSPQFLLFAFIYLFLFYFNSFYLITAIYLKKQYVFYALIVLAFFVAVFYLKPFEHLLDVARQNERTSDFHLKLPPPPIHSDAPNAAIDHPPAGEPGRGRFSPHRNGAFHLDIVSLILFFMIWSISWGLQLFKQWRLVEKRAAQAEAEKARAELSFLQAQINPHFLFNTLNNIYSLAVSNSSKTAPSIMKLSKIMRYVTDEVREDYVDLEDELEFIKDYIELQKLRLSEKVIISFTVQGVVEGIKIAPLILMPFIENVFKYGISNHESCSIIIKIEAKENMILFFCSNKMFLKGKNETSTGIGIENTRQRLAHLYPQKHTLNITTNEQLFTIQLSLQL